MAFSRRVHKLSQFIDREGDVWLCSREILEGTNDILIFCCIYEKRAVMRSRCPVVDIGVATSLAPSIFVFSRSYILYICVE